MKKTILITSIVVLAMAALGVGVVFAQGPQPPTTNGGMMGWMHDYVEEALATKLGLTEAQVEEQFAAGKTMFQIALDNGIAQENVTTFLNDVHQEAFANAVKAGVMTQAQADWMLQRMQNRGYGDGTGTGCPMHGGQGGNGYGRGMMQNGGGRGMMGNWGQGAQQNP